MSSFVCVDACVVVKWLLTEDDSDIALALAAYLRDADDVVIAPPHMPIEVTNVIRKRVRLGDLSPIEGDELVEVLMALPIQTAAPQGLYKTALDLAHRFGRPTVYDTQYVALAQIAGCDFWTADQRLINALDGRLSFVRPLQSFQAAAAHKPTA